jgi:hypothetical protein
MKEFKIWVFFLSCLFILNMQGCSKESSETKLRERVDRYLKLQTFKDFEGMSEFILKEENVEFGEHIFKDSKELLFSFRNNMFPIEKYEILEINIDDSGKRADVKIGCTCKTGATSSTGTFSTKWIYLDNWYIDIKESPGCAFIPTERQG